MKISKEKTAKIIPNAVGVATIDERHVFGSFMSREAAYRLMLSVWRPIADADTPPAIVAAAVAATHLSVTPNGGNVDISECSIEEDSSSAISGNESPGGAVAAMLQLGTESTTSTDANHTHTIRHRMQSTAGNDEIDGAGQKSTSNSSHASPSKGAKSLQSLPSSRSTSPAPRIVRVNRFYQFPLPDRCVNIGIVLSIMLAILSIFLFYRIMNFPSRGPSIDPTSIPIDIKWVSGRFKRSVRCSVSNNRSLFRIRPPRIQTNMQTF